MKVVTLIEPPDVIERQVLFAVELVDPITSALVYRDVTVKAEGLTRLPIINRSGRFVWLAEDDKWPGVITVTPHGLPFAEQRHAAPPRPADLSIATAEQLTVRITLRPTAAYPADAGVTVVRGQLFDTADGKAMDETADGNPTPVPNVRVQLAWRDDTTGVWEPAPPAAEPDGDDPEAPSPREVQTDARGQFVAVLRFRPLAGADPDLINGMLKVRLQFTRGPRATPETLVTPKDFAFLPEADAPADDEPPLSDSDEEKRIEREGRVFEGRVLSRDVRLALSELKSP